MPDGDQPHPDARGQYGERKIRAGHLRPFHPEHPFVQTLKKAAEEVLGREVEFIGRAGGLDTRFSRHFNMAAACTGPRAGGIHGIDEYVEIPSIIQVTQVLAMAALQWCGY